MSEKKLKPIKKGEMISLYVAGIVGQLLTIVMWFFPTLKATYFSSVTSFTDTPEIEITLFSYNDSLPVVTNYMNIAFLLLSVISLICMVIPPVKKTIMHPHTMIFPAVFNAAYLVLFLVRYINAINSYPLYDVSNTAVSFVYFLGMVFAFSAAASIVIYYPRLKKQLKNDVSA